MEIIDQTALSQRYASARSSRPSLEAKSAPARGGKEVGLQAVN